MGNTHQTMSVTGVGPSNGPQGSITNFRFSRVVMAEHGSSKHEGLVPPIYGPIRKVAPI
jgi:hypothetical protein